eukprot:8139991-Pyramimonas_sp.AAC.1
MDVKSSYWRYTRLMEIDPRLMEIDTRLMEIDTRTVGVLSSACEFSSAECERMGGVGARGLRQWT